MIKTNLKQAVFKYFALSLLIVALCPAEINGLHPFAVAMFCAMTFAGANPFVLLVPLTVGQFLAGPDWAVSVSALAGAAIIAVTDFFLRKKFNSYGVAVMVCLTALAVCPAVAVEIAKGYPAAYVIISVCLYLIFTYVSYGIAKPLLYYDMKHSLLDTEKACLYIVMVAAAMGITGTEVPGNAILCLVAGAALPFVCRFIGKGACVMTALSLGLGSAFCTLDVTNVALFGFVALSCCMFITSPKILSPLAQVFAAVIFELFFSVPYVDLGYHAGALLLGGIVYAVIPEKVVSAVKSKFFSSDSGNAVRHVINKNRTELSRRAAYVGDVFEEMSDILGGMEKTGDSVVIAVAGEVEKNVCASCERYRECVAAGMSKHIMHVSEKCFEKGKASMNDLPCELVDRCLYLGKIMSVCTSKMREAGASRENTESDNKVNRLLAEQLGGVGKILHGMSENVARPVVFDEKIERKIIEELKYYNVVCSEILLCGGDKPSATAIIRNECAGDRKLIANVVGKCAGVNFLVKSVEDSVIAGWSVMDFELKPKFDVTFGVATRPLHADATGDTHSFMKTGGDKFLMALCDGMGAGKKAYELSEKAISLVESFYKAGFDHRVTVDGINRFLTIEGGESFSALDIAAVDLSAGKADLVKLAAPRSFVKRADFVEAFDSSSLPLGVVADAKPSLCETELNDGDVIVLMSDGVSGRFDEEELAAIINRTSGVNPQLMADELMKKALERKTGYDDDMTVAVCRIMQNCDK